MSVNKVVYPKKLIFFFFSLLALVILIEYSSQGKYKDLDQQMHSMYKDRLMPATYLFRLNNHLHNKQRWQEANQFHNKGDVSKLEEYNESMGSLIALYEKTYLTPRETDLWASFKSNLAILNAAERNLMVLPSDKQASAEHIRSFEGAAESLSKLSDLQSQEGLRLQTSSESILSGNLMQNILELALLFIICVLAIHWFNTTAPGMMVNPFRHSAN
jgi:hypothetical protein